MTALSPAGVWAELPFQFQEGRPRGESSVCMSGLCTLILCFACGALPFPTCDCSEGLEPEAKRADHCQVHVGEVERNSCRQAEGRGGEGRRRRSSPRRGCQLSAPTLHLPISLQFKESFLHLSASGVWDRFVAKEGWAAPRILAGLGTRFRKGWVGPGQFPCPQFAVGPQAQD